MFGGNMPTNSSLSESISETFTELCLAAATLNNVSDALGHAVAEIDESLKKFNLGIEVWHHIDGGQDDDAVYWGELIGYAKIGGRWGVSLQRLEGHDPDDPTVEKWLFNDAPRSFRLEAVGKLPALLKTMSAEANKTAKELRAKLTDVQEIAAALKESTGEKARRGTPRETLPPEITQAMGSHKPKPIDVDDQGGNK
jgi:hypothetical protein